MPACVLGVPGIIYQASLPLNIRYFRKPLSIRWLDAVNECMPCAWGTLEVLLQCFNMIPGIWEARGWKKRGWIGITPPPRMLGKILHNKLPGRKSGIFSSHYFTTWIIMHLFYRSVVISFLVASYISSKKGPTIFKLKYAGGITGGQNTFPCSTTETTAKKWREKDQKLSYYMPGIEPSTHYVRTRSWYIFILISLDIPQCMCMIFNMDHS